MPLVGIVMGSDSDLPVMKAAAEILEELEVPYELSVLSAHRTPDRVETYAKEAAGRGLRVIIAGAGGAAHLAGVIAAYTELPVIGVPVLGKTLGGADALYSMVQMPPGIPVATVGINGAKNAGLLAVEILGVGEETYRRKIREYKNQLAREVEAKAARLEAVGWRAYLAAPEQS
ncbi:MAG: 5-(carboxyamino)imidazole ribonucleotide mutase [Firmicutes bacterium]|nr:5-(carboxyamino)imidazole ribonucleotide mutase [Bacillota bacterium]